jgi:lantibiotic modifying enzyme
MFILTESFPRSRERISSELFGTPADIREPGIIGQVKEEVFENLERSNHLYKSAKDSGRDSLGAKKFIDRWVVQESHSGQRRPVLTETAGKPRFYKPRSMGPDIAWDNLICWYSQTVSDGVSEPLEISPCLDWGWMTLIEPAICREEEISRFYHRLGLLAALIWIVGGTDATGANVIAAGSLPTLIDAEMTMVPGDTLFADSFATEFRRVGVAPFRAPDEHGHDVSLGAGSLSNVPCAHRCTAITNTAYCKLCHNVPSTREGPRHVDEFVPAMSAGFHKGVRAIYMKRSELLANNSPLGGYEAANGRVVFRPSAAYAMVRKWMFAELRKTGRFPAVDELLKRMSLKQSSMKHDGEVLRDEEIRSLKIGDLPRFEMCMNERSVTRESRNFATFRFSGRDRAHGRLKALSPVMLENAVRNWDYYLRAAIRKDRMRA